jgi:hypothetical protein
VSQHQVVLLFGFISLAFVAALMGPALDNEQQSFLSRPSWALQYIPQMAISTLGKFYRWVETELSKVLQDDTLATRAAGIRSLGRLASFDPAPILPIIQRFLHRIIVKL